MASQNLPGVAAIYAAGYGPDSACGGIPMSKIITLSGIATLVLAPFGAFALNLSAITAAICMGKEAHEDPAKRYTAAVSLRRDLRRDRHLRRGHHRPADGLPEGAGGGHRRAGAAGHHRQRAGGRGEGRIAPRGGAYHVSRHARRAW